MVSCAPTIRRKEGSLTAVVVTSARHWLCILLQLAHIPHCNGAITHACQTTGTYHARAVGLSSPKRQAAHQQDAVHVRPSPGVNRAATQLTCCKEVLGPRLQAQRVDFLLVQRDLLHMATQEGWRC